MRKKNLVLVVCLLLGCESFSQSSNLGDGAANQQNLEALGDQFGGTVLAFDQRYSGVKGSPLVFEEWQAATVFQDGNAFKLELNINALDNDILARRNKNRIIVNKQKVDSIIVTTDGDKIFYETIENCICERIVVGSYSLYKEFKKEILKADFKGAYSANRTSDEIVNKTVFHYKNENSKLTLVKKKNLKETFADQKKLINKTDINDQKSLMLFFQSVNK